MNGLSQIGYIFSICPVLSFKVCLEERSCSVRFVGTHLQKRSGKRCVCIYL